MARILTPCGPMYIRWPARQHAKRCSPSVRDARRDIESTGGDHQRRLGPAESIHTFGRDFGFSIGGSRDHWQVFSACGHRIAVRHFFVMIQIYSVPEYIRPMWAFFPTLARWQVFSSNSSPFARSPRSLLTWSARSTNPLVPSVRVSPITTSVRLPMSRIASGKPSAKSLNGLCGFGWTWGESKL
jgi:hypothetical protein